MDKLRLKEMGWKFYSLRDEFEQSVPDFLDSPEAFRVFMNISEAAVSTLILSQ